MESAIGPGRPRSEAARHAVLAAALDLAVEDGYAAVTIKGIAGRAGVGRQTVYRWWRTKAEVLLEAVTEFAAVQADVAPSGDALADLRQVLRNVLAQSEGLGPVIAGLMADAIADPAFSVRLRERLLARRRQMLRSVFEAGQASGQLPADYPVDLAIDMVFGVLSYRLLSGPAELDPDLAGELADALRRLAARPEPPAGGVSPGSGDDRPERSGPS